MLRLRVRPPGGHAYVVTLKTFPVKIGRAPASDLRLDDLFASRAHAELALDGGGLRLRDLGSGNGSFVNGLRVGGGPPAPTEAALQAGDRVRIGNSVLEIESWEPGGESAARQAPERPRRPAKRGAETLAIDPQARAAYELKLRLLPQSAPAIAGYELAGGSHPSLEVGGESFDFVDLGQGKVLLAQADVSGKGLDAALLTAILHASLAALAATGLPVANLAARLNTFLCRRAPAQRFVTLFLAVLDTARHHLTYVNAGHPQPLLMRADGALDMLAAGSPPVGVQADAAFEPAEVALAPGDVLIVASDGVLHAKNSAGEELPAGRLAEVARRYTGALASELQVLIEQELAGFLGARAAADDRTLMVLRRTP